MALVTYAQAKLHLRIESDYEVEDVRSKIDQASAAVIEFVDNATLTATWDETTVPEQARAATLELLHFLYKRDQAYNAKTDLEDCLPPRVTMFLKRLRKPVMGMPA